MRGDVFDYSFDLHFSDFDFFYFTSDFMICFPLLRYIHFFQGLEVKNNT